MAFKGVGSMPAVGSAVLFEGFKISAEAAMQAEPWSTFSASAWEVRGFRGGVEVCGRCIGPGESWYKGVCNEQLYK